MPAEPLHPPLFSLRKADVYRAEDVSGLQEEQGVFVEGTTGGRVALPLFGVVVF